MKAIVNGKTGRVRQKIDHAIGVGIGERLEENLVDYGKNRGVGSDSQRKGGNGSAGEAGILEEHSE